MSIISPPRLETQSFTDPELAWKHLAELDRKSVV